MIWAVVGEHSNPLSRPTDSSPIAANFSWAYTDDVRTWVFIWLLKSSLFAFPL